MKKKEMIAELSTLRAQHRISQEQAPTSSVFIKDRSKQRAAFNDYQSTCEENRSSTLDYSKSKILRNSSLETRATSPRSRRKQLGQLMNINSFQESMNNTQDDELCNTSSINATHGNKNPNGMLQPLNTQSMENLSPGSYHNYQNYLHTTNPTARFKKQSKVLAERLEAKISALSEQ